MKIIGNINLGKIKIYYAATQEIIDTINEDNFPDGLKKEYIVDEIIGVFHIQSESFTMTHKRNFGRTIPINIFPNFTFKFGDNDLNNPDKNIFHAKLKSLREQGCIVSGLLRFKEHEWLFIAKFPNLPIPNQFPFVVDNLDYSDF